MNDVTAQDWIAFGVFVLVGFLVGALLAGVRFVTPGAVEDIPDSLIIYLPRDIVAAVVLILG